MKSIFTEETWKEFLEKLSSYEGTLSSFCRENNITPHQFYYYKKKFNKSQKTTFHAIVLNDEKPTEKQITNSVKENTNIRIEIGKVNIYVPKNEIVLLSTLLKELAKLC